MEIKLAAVVILALWCPSVSAERLQVSSVSRDQQEGVSFVVTLPPGIETAPKVSDFQLLDGARLLKSAETIEPFGKSGKALVLLLCIDASKSMTNAVLKETQNALISLLAQIRPEDRLGLVSFADKVTTDAEFTGDRNQLIKSIRKLKTRGKKTVLYQALVDALNKLNNEKTGDYRRLLLVSDGKDEESVENINSAIELSNNYGIPIDIVGRGKIEQQYTKQLSALASATGGRFVYARPDQVSLKDAVVRVYKNVIEDTWIVRFKYKPAAGKGDLKNGVVKFQTNTASSSSVEISKDIPVPEEALPVIPQQTAMPTVDKAEKWGWKKWLPYFGLVLILLSIGLILWLLLHRFRREKTEPVELRNLAGLGNTPRPSSIPDLNVRHYLDPKPRQTVVGSGAGIAQAAPEFSKWVLVVLKGPLEGRKFQVDKPLFSIGADTDNDLVLVGDDYISGSHAQLKYENGEVLLSDQHSRNGTVLNGEPVKDTAVAIHPGDVIELGNTSLKVTEP